MAQRTRKMLWIVSSVIGIYSMFSVTLYYIPTYHYTQLESALYNSLHRLGWSLFTGWMVLGCVTSEGNALKTFLSSQILVPISRLTYCAYLTNGFIELYLAASIRTPKYMSVSNLVIFFYSLFIFWMSIFFFFHINFTVIVIQIGFYRLARRCRMSHLHS